MGNPIVVVRATAPTAVPAPTAAAAAAGHWLDPNAGAARLDVPPAEAVATNGAAATASGLPEEGGKSDDGCMFCHQLLWGFAHKVGLTWL
jgi:hypothetical protein